MKRLSLLLCAMLMCLALPAQVLRDGGKLSPSLRHVVRQHHRQALYSYDARHICLLMKCEGDASSVLSRHGGTLLATIGEVQVADVPIASIETLASEAYVQRLEAERMPRAEMRVTPGDM